MFQTLHKSPDAFLGVLFAWFLFCCLSQGSTPFTNTRQSTIVPGPKFPPKVPKRLLTSTLLSLSWFYSWSAPLSFTSQFAHRSFPLPLLYLTIPCPFFSANCVITTEVSQHGHYSMSSNSFSSLFAITQILFITPPNKQEQEKKNPNQPNKKTPPQKQTEKSTNRNTALG